MSGKAEPEFRMATVQDVEAILEVGDDLFDNVPTRELTTEFLNDERHHMALAYVDGRIVGMASAFHYVHPDKPTSLFVNEVGVVDAFQKQGIGRNLVKYLLQHGEGLGCQEAWVATESSNTAARRTYVAAGGNEGNEPIVLVTFGDTDQKGSR